MSNDEELVHDFKNARRGAVIGSRGKTRVTMYLDDDVLEHFRKVATANGRGYQTEINACLRQVANQNQVYAVGRVRNADTFVSLTEVSGVFNALNIPKRSGKFIVREKGNSLRLGINSLYRRELRV